MTMSDESALTALSLVDGTMMSLLAPGRHKLGPLMVTEEGLCLGRLVEERGYWLGYLTQASPWIAFRPVMGEVQLGGEWLDAASLAIGDGRRVVRHDVAAGTRRRVNVTHNES